MIDKRMQDALNEQIKWELYSAYLYLSMSAHLSSMNLMGFANWMRVQAQEELAHAMKFYGFIEERGGRVTLAEVGKPPVEWASPLAAFEDALGHEQGVTSRINNLVDLALSEKDHATHNFLQWFVSEQVELTYDLDVELRTLASELRVNFARVRAVDDHPAFIRLLAELVRGVDPGGVN